MFSVKVPLLQIAFSLYCFLFCLVRAQDPFAYVNPEKLDYTIYPVGARQCVLNHVRQLSCNRLNVYTWNGCVCSNSENIVFNVASCVKEASPGDMASTYGTLKFLCDTTGTPISVSLNQWINTGTDVSGNGSGNSISSSVNSLATHSPSGFKTENGDAGGGGLSKSDQIALGAGISGGVLTLVGVIIAWRMYRQGRAAMRRR